MVLFFFLFLFSHHSLLLVCTVQQNAVSRRQHSSLECVCLLNVHDRLLIWQNSYKFFSWVAHNEWVLCVCPPPIVHLHSLPHNPYTPPFLYVGVGLDRLNTSPSLSPDLLAGASVFCPLCFYDNDTLSGGRLMV